MSPRLPGRLARAAALPILALAVSWPGAGARAQPAPNPPVLQFDQRLGAAIPPGLAFRDQAGRAVTLGDYFAQRPVILVLGYYRCPMLCSTLMDGILQSLRSIGVDYEVVAASIDPRETPRDAARKYAAYRALAEPGRGERLHLLTGEAAPVAGLARAAGFPYRRDPATGQYGHPAGFLVLTPEGRVSRYFPGLRFAPKDVRLALVEASSGRVGTLSDRLALLCYHYDPRHGRYDLAVMAVARAVGLATLAALAVAIAVMIRRRRP